MTDKEVLRKAIGIAMDNDENYYCDRLNAISPKPDEFDYRGIIFSHDFAKAFWGEEPFNGFKTFFSDGYTYTMKPLYQMCNDPEAAKRADAVWKAHLQQMVLCENTIDYLRKFIKDDKT